MNLILLLAISSIATTDSIHLTFDKLKKNEIGRNMPINAQYLPVRAYDKATFDVVFDPSLGRNVLRACADDATGFLKLEDTQVDLNKTPIASWQWKVTHMSDSVTTQDVVAPIVLVFYTGGKFRQELLAYAWAADIEPTEKTWNTRRNEECKFFYKNLHKTRGPFNVWVAEKQNVRDDFKRAFGYVPKKLYVGVKILTSPHGGYAESMLSPLKFEKEEGVE